MPVDTNSMVRPDENVDTINQDNAVHTTGSSEALLIALETFIMPMIHATTSVELEQENRARSTHASVTARNGATELLGALEKFVSAMIHTYHRQIYLNNTLREEDNPTTPPKFEDKSSTLVRAANQHEDTTDENENQKSVHKLLGSLRQHVFNNMPIRLLCFNAIAGELKIELVERGSIYDYLASILQQKSTLDEFLSDIEQEVWWYEGDREFAEEKVVNRWVSKTARYAILSHTWLRDAPGEVTYANWTKASIDISKPGYQKLVNFCKTATQYHGLTLGWMDTVCINKDSSAELDESIRTMYKWYHDSSVCIVYLAETSTLSDVHLDPWFTRGWTLQELLAPRHVKFYNVHWKEIIPQIDNDKRESQIRAEIKRATTITREELVNIHSASISRRMEWAATRKVTREEDTAYSLMGLFDVSISIAYGEGAERAFFRLVREVLGSSPYILDIFNWAGELPPPWKRVSSLFPFKPHQYLCRATNLKLDELRPVEPVTLTHLGLRVPILLLPATSAGGKPTPKAPVGDYNALVTISPREAEKEIPTVYCLLAARSIPGDGWISETTFQLTFGILNFGGDETSVQVPKTCLAVALSCQQGAGCVTSMGQITKIDTNAPIVFNLRDGQSGEERSRDHDVDYYSIDRRSLACQGMQLVTLYL